MHCIHCGQELRDDAMFCTQCGAKTAAPHTNAPPKSQSTAKNKRKIAVIVTIIAVAVVTIAFAAFLLLFLFRDQLNPNPTTATTPPTPTVSAYTQTEAAPTEIPTEEPTAAVFSISDDELEAEIVKIREYYYSPTSDDDQIVLENGTDGWHYSRDYRYHNGKLIFAFIFDGTEEHRLYFKDDHMIRYIDENHVTYDYPDTTAYVSWEEKALTEAYEKYGGSAAPVEGSSGSGWIGTWESDTGESFEITYVDAAGLKAIYHHMNEVGDRWLSTPMNMIFTDSTHLTVIEDLDVDTWKYSFTLCDGYLLVESRYPDKKFYKVQ